MEARKFTHQDILKAMQGVKQYGLITDDATLEMFSSAVRNPEALTKEHLDFIGDAYNNKYPVKKKLIRRIFTPHTNHSSANQLKANASSSPQTRWNDLINLYSKLPNTNGDLAMTLLYVFGWAFDKRYQTFDISRMPFLNFSPAEVAQQLKASVNEYYAAQFQKVKRPGEG